MASQTFTEAIHSSQGMVIYANNRDIKGHFCDPKLDRSTLPNSWHAYDLRHDDDGCGIIVEMCHDHVLVNNAGTFFTQEDIPELNAAGSSINFETDPEEWEMYHDSNEPCPASNPNDWGYSLL